jgi:acetyltransferase-like isoleucine patch superfamily enzyme
LNSLSLKNVYQESFSLIRNSKVGSRVRIGRRALVEDSEVSSFTYVSNDTQIKRASIGKFCSIASNCLIGLGTHPSRDYVSSHPIFFSTQKQVGITFADKNYFQEVKPVSIGNDVWIGVNVVVMGGVNIGDGAIIGAGAVVTKDVPPYAIYGGVPAKLIRYRFEQEEISFLLAFKWWDKDITWLAEHYQDFHSISSLLQKQKIEDFS